MNSKKCILISGSEGNVGKAIVKLFHDNGWKVIGIDIKDAAESSPDEYIKCDITDINKLSNEIGKIEKTQPIDAMFNAAGYELTDSFEAATSDEWAKLLDTILGGSANLCEVVAPKMIERKEGKIILLSTDYRNISGDCIMNATATGTLHGFGKSFGVEIAENNVLENVLFANAPFDLEKIANTVFFLADKDTYTSAQVISITGKEC